MRLTVWLALSLLLALLSPVIAALVVAWLTRGRE